MAADWTFHGAILAEDGTAITVHRKGALIRLCIISAGNPAGEAIVMDDGARDAFMHAWADAEHQAEREAVRGA